MAGMLGLMWACNSTPSTSYSINGTTDLADGETLKLMYRVSDDSTFVDSCVVTGGKFSFNGNIEKPDQAFIFNGETYYNNNKTRQIMLEPGEYTMELTGEEYFKSPVTGSLLTLQLDSITNLQYEMNSQFMDLRQQMSTLEEGDTVKAKEIEQKYMALYDELQNARKDFVKNHPASYVSPLVLRNIIYNLSLDELKEIYNGWTPEIQAADVKTGEYITAMENVQPGKPAPEIAGKDQNDQDVSLSGLKGKVVLLDFWATWCGPCRASLPHVKEVFEKYNGNGLEVLCVSLDQEEDAWKKYIAESGMGMEKYHHVYERGCGWNSKDAKNYAVKGIPAKFLIDADGNIIGKFDSNEELDAKLAEIFPQK